MIPLLTDPVIHDLLLGVIGNGLWSLASSSGTSGYEQVRGLISPPKPAVVAAIKAASKNIKNCPEFKSSPKGSQENFTAFLRSPEVESIVRQLFATSIVEQGTNLQANSVGEEFAISLSAYTAIPRGTIQPFSDAFFAGLLAGVEDSLQAAIEKNVLGAHEAQSSRRHNLLINEISSVKKTIELLKSPSPPDVKAIVAFEKSYRQHVAKEHSEIRPPQLDSGHRVPINEVFVAPRITLVKHDNPAESEPIPLDVFLSKMHRGVLLGSPGGGKSTTSAKICYDLSSRYEDRLFSGREITPILVVLRDFGSRKKASSCSIVKFIEEQARSNYQLEPPDRSFEYLLLSGRALVIFDGLDELLETNYRREITSNVEHFCELYPSVPVLVTSREVGYEQAPLDGKVFAPFRLASFSDEQVLEYANKWFARDDFYTIEQQKQKAQSFFADSAIVSDLRSNPLMLGLMCNLYRAEGYIPRNRPEVYKKCSIMLFERWDKSRDIQVSLPFEEHLVPAMQDLAYWIYSNADLQGGVTEDQLIQRTSEYLSKWVFDNIQKSRSAATEFVKFCNGRAWVFTDTGTTRDGDALFQFTHRTFLEFFTASHLVALNPTPDKLIRVLAPRIGNGEWDVIAQLAFQIQSKQVHGAADELLTLLLEGPPATIRKTAYRLSFAERTLEFLVPKPQSRRLVVKSAFEYWINQLRKRRRANFAADLDDAFSATSHIQNLLVATLENRDTVADELVIKLLAEIDTDTDSAGWAAEATLGLSAILNLGGYRRQIAGELRNYWQAVSDRVSQQALVRIREISKKDWNVALSSYFNNLISLTEAIEAHGIGFLVTTRRSEALGGVMFIPAGYRLLHTVLGSDWFSRESVESRLQRFKELEMLAPIILSNTAPWTNERPDQFVGDWLVQPKFNFEGPTIEPLELSVDAKFSMTCLLAADLEQTKMRRSNVEIEKFIRDSRIPSFLKQILLGRLGNGRELAILEFSKLGFDTNERHFLTQWLDRKFNFLGAVKSRVAADRQASGRKRKLAGQP